MPLLLVLLALSVQSLAVMADSLNPVRISGHVIYQERIHMPGGSRIRVTLEDVSRADAEAEVLGEQIVTPENDEPVAFSLQYDAAKIDPASSYALRAQIQDARGRLLWTTTTHHGVLTRGFPSDDIDLVVEPVTTQAGRVPRTLVFDCSGLEMIVRYGPGEAAIWLPGRYTIVSQVRTASGVRYEGDGIIFSNKGDEVLLEVDGVGYQRCQRNPQREPWADAERRGVDFRATGNEPPWQLEISRGRQLQMTVGYDGQPVLTAAPEADAIDGGYRYHAVTEAHDLLVEIQYQPCYDSMSGAYHQASVSVTLDSVTYRGCGKNLIRNYR